MATTAKNNGENVLNNQIDSVNPLNPQNQIPTRQDILIKLYNRSLWISEKIDNSHTKFTPQLEARVRYAKVECTFLHVILEGLKDIEIDDLRQEIEEIKELMKHEHK